MKKTTNPLWELLGFAWHLGYLITVPLIGLSLLGRFLDTRVSASPLFFIVGIIGGILTSSILVVRKTTALIKNVTEEEKQSREAGSSSAGKNEKEVN
ncbi:MAG: AtpZ/AtpI family protein [bacterium]|nr:AtpZ/AtpI family protein [bacterium]